VTRFTIQLEYWLDGDWREIVHDQDAPGGHDVTEERLHRDVYRDDGKYRTEEISPPIPANEAFDHAEEDLRENAELFIRRFERWHGVKDRSDP